MSLEHLLESLGQVSSFSHAQCDAILQSRHVEVVNAYFPGKAPGNRDSVWLGLYFSAGWLLLVFIGSIWAWRRRTDRNKWLERFIFLFYGILGVGLLYDQLFAMAQYADVCRQLLASPSFVPGPSKTVGPAAALVSIAAFAGVWFCSALHMYRNAKHAKERNFAIVMTVLGGAFFAIVGASIVFQLFHPAST